MRAELSRAWASTLSVPRRRTRSPAWMCSWSHSHVKDLELGQELKSCPEPSIGIRENVLMSFKIRIKIPSSAEEQVLICNISVFVFIPKHLVKCNFRILLRRKAKRHKHVKGSQKPVGPRLRPAVALSGLVLP